ncbi:MAG: PAS domain-containing protein [Chloroflexi bacterium]|nr:PAS domain-containing protein [Chloroflexota bacterium]
MSILSYYMIWQFNPYAIPVFLSLPLLAYFMHAVWPRRHEVLARLFLWLAGMTLLTMLAYGMELSSADLPTIVWWARVKNIGALPLTTLFLLFMLAYSEWQHYVTRRLVLLLSIAPLLYLIVIWTNDLHHWHWAQVDTRLVGTLVFLDITYANTPIFWAGAVYFFVTLLLASALIVRRLRLSARMYRRQALLLLLVMGVIWLGSLLDFNPWNLFPYLRFTLFGIMLSCLILGWSLLLYHMLDLTPIAKDMLIKSMSDALFVLDHQQRIVDMNPAAEKLTSKNAAQMIGRAASDVFHGQHHLLERYLNVYEASEELSLVHNNELCYFDMRISPLRSRSGELHGRVIVLRNITMRKQAEQQALEMAIEREEIRLLKSFIGNATHDFMTPITVLKTSAHLLKMYTVKLVRQIDDLQVALPEQLKPLTQVVQQTGESVQQKGEQIEMSAERLHQLLATLIEMLRLDQQVSFKFEPLDANALIEDALRLQQVLAEAKGLTLRFEPDKALPPLLLDRDTFMRVVQILLDNALTYTEKGSISVRTQRETHTLLLEVRDTGIGIPADELPHIFERFYRVDKTRSMRSGGMGLGLAIAKKIVMAHQGEITAESTPGVGSVFRVRLPLPLVTPPNGQQ